MEEAVTVEEALEMYTVAGAYATFEEDIKGQLKVGMLADVTILERDPRTVDPMALAELKVRDVYKRQPTHPAAGEQTATSTGRASSGAPSDESAVRCCSEKHNRKSQFAARVDEEICLGCGVCKSACKVDNALGMDRRPKKRCV